MSRVSNVVLGAVMAVLILCIGVNRTQAQAAPANPPAAEAQKPATPPDAKDKDKERKTRKKISSRRSPHPRCLPA